MKQLHETHKKLITMYVTTLMNAAPIYADREATIKVWLDAFSYIQTTMEYLAFEKACKQLINNNESLDKMPLPGKIKQMIDDNNRGYKGLVQRPFIRPEFKKLIKEWKEISKKIWDAKNEHDKQKKAELMIDYWSIAEKICHMSGVPFKP